jgi:hypothetical protein
MTNAGRGRCLRRDDHLGEHDAGAAGAAADDDDDDAGRDSN